MTGAPEDKDHRPVPDPTTLTTENMLREVNHLRETIESRLDYLDSSIERRLGALDILTESRFVTHRTLLDSQSEKVALALSAADKAVNKAELFNEKRFESLSEKIDDLKITSTLLAGKSTGLNQGWGYLVGAIGLIIVVVNVGVALAAK